MTVHYYPKQNLPATNFSPLKNNNNSKVLYHFLRGKPVIVASFLRSDVIKTTLYFVDISK